MKGKPQALLIAPPVYDFALFDLFLKPYGLLRLAAWFENAGYKIGYVNALSYQDEESEAVLKPPKRKNNGTGKFYRQRVPMPQALKGYPTDRSFARYGILEESFRNKVASFRPDIILITSVMTYWYMGVAEAVRIARECHPGVPVVLGGIYASLMPEHARKTMGPDLVVIGEAEEPLRAFLESQGLPAPCGPVPPFPLLIEPSFTQGAAFRLNEGCPYRCDYCASRLISPGFTSGRPEEAFQALMAIKKRWGTVNIGLYDDALLFRKEEILIPFLERVIASEEEFRFYNPNAVHIRYLDSQVISLMKKAGFQEFRLGFESADETFHEERDRKTGNASFLQAVEAFREADFPLNKVAVYVLAGLPGQRAEEVEMSLRYAMKSGVVCRLAQYSPVPGTALWPLSQKTADCPLEEPLFHNNTFFPFQNPSFTRKDLNRLKKLAQTGREA